MLSIIARRLLAGILGLTCCVNATAGDIAVPFSHAAYEAVATDKALILVSANWARHWKCGEFENAQLQSLGFDRAGSKKEETDEPDILLDGCPPSQDS